MRSLIVRFKDCEGPGIIEDSLRKANYKITYHDSYKRGLQLVPDAHQIFDIIILLGGPKSVFDPKESKFFKPYLKLVENSLSMPGKKILGICLGSQIIANVLGSEVKKGEKGLEVGFSKVSVLNSPHPIFQGITSSHISAFHLHEDTFELPNGVDHLLSSEKYSSQMFAYKDKAYAIQCHFEVTYPMLEVWWNIHKEIPKSLGNISEEIKIKQKEMEANARILFENIVTSKAK